MAKTFDEVALSFFRNRPIRRTPVILIDEAEYDHLPSRTLEDRLKEASEKLNRFWNTPLRNFWRSVYIHYRDELYKKEKAGRPAPTAIPASDNHDGKPAA